MDEALQRQQTRDRVKRYRERQKLQDSVTAAPSNVTPDVTPLKLCPYSKEEQVKVLMSKTQAARKQAVWEELQRA